MQVDARAFFSLITQTGDVCKCLRPKRTSSRNPYSGSPGNRAYGEDETHTVTVFSPIPTSLQDNTEVTIDNVKYRVRRNGLMKTPAGGHLSLSHEFVEPAQKSPKTGIL